MPLVNIACLLADAKAKKYAVPAFNIDNLESALAVSEAAKEFGLPVIVQTIPRTINYASAKVYAAMVRSLFDGGPDYALHLDHGSSLALIKDCIDAGYSSVMLDASHLPLSQNIALSAEAVRYARPLGISVEAELGAVGGKEEGDTELESNLTKVDEAVEFIAKTGVDALAVGVGTAHGFYKGVPKINTVRIKEIAASVATPLVLHGASGLLDEVIAECIECGICKINFATELRAAYTNAVREELARDLSVFDPKIYLRKAIDGIKAVVSKKIRLCMGIKQ